MPPAPRPRKDVQTRRLPKEIKEPIMHPPRGRTVQTDLFGLRDEADHPLDTPPWRSLPQPTRRRATDLMTQLFVEHLRTEADPDRDPENDDV